MVVANFFEYLKVNVKGQRSTPQKWMVRAYSGNFSYNDNAVQLK